MQSASSPIRYHLYYRSRDVPMSSVHPAILTSAREATPIFIGGHSASLSAQIVGQVRDALFAKKLKSGDFLGTEKDLAARFGVSRIVARDALRTLQALGIADIKMGKGGGARVSRGNPRLFAEALAVQLDLTGVSAAEIMDAQRAIETLAAELAAEHATAADHEKLRRLLDEAEAIIDDTPAYTRSCRDFHLAVAEASHNRVLVTQLISLQHVSWPSENRTLTPPVARRILAVHRELYGLIEMRDAAGARRLMDDHVKMIRAPARRRARTRHRSLLLDKKPKGRTPWTSCAIRSSSSSRTSGCRNGSPRRRATSRTKGSTTNSAKRCKATGGKIHDKGAKVGAYQTFEKGRKSDVSCACHWTVNVAASHGHGKLYADFYSVAPSGVFVPADSPVKTPEDLAGVPISVGFQSGSHYSTIQALEQYLPRGQDQAVVRRRHAVPPPGAAGRRQAAGRRAVQRALLLRRAARLPQGHRHHLHDHHDDHRQPRPGGRAQVLPRAAPRATRHRRAPGALHALLQTTNSRRASTPRWTRGAGARASASCSSPTRARCSRSRASGSPTTASSPIPAWAAGSTKARSSRWRGRRNSLIS